MPAGASLCVTTLSCFLPVTITSASPAIISRKIPKRRRSVNSRASPRCRAFLSLCLIGSRPARVRRPCTYGCEIPPAAPQLSVKPGNLPGRPQWQWSSRDGAVTFLYKLNDTRLEVGAVETQAFSYTPGAPLSAGTAVLYVQARDEAGLWSAMSRATIVISAEDDAAAVQGGVSAFSPSVQAVTPVNSPFPRWTWNSLQGGGGIFRVRLDQPDL